MDEMQKQTTMPDKAGYAFYDYDPPEEDMAQAVLAGLKNEPKFIEPKYFYDQLGSELFEQITRLEEYYPTRTELGLFDAYLGEVSEHLGEALCLIEYGSGNSVKIRKLLESLTPDAYVPVDISKDHLRENAEAVHRDFPGLGVFPICADFTSRLTLPPQVEKLEKMAFFPGSSIGNFTPPEARVFLENIRATVGPSGLLLIGVDRKKDARLLENAYDDAAGVTAAFNLNVLAHINRRLHADFDLDAYQHIARYNEAEGRIEMFLRTTRQQKVTVAGEQIAFAADELLHTENSYKYNPEEFRSLAASAGFIVERHWTDDRAWFSLFLLKADP